MEKTKDWLKDADAIIIECYEDEVNEHSLVDVTPFNTKTKEHLINVRREMILKDAEKIKKRQIVHGDNLMKYYQSQLNK